MLRVWNRQEVSEKEEGWGEEGRGEKEGGRERERGGTEGGSQRKCETGCSIGPLQA